MHMHVRTPGSCPSNAQGFSRGQRLEREGGTSVREGSADDVGVARDPVNVRDGVIAEPRTD